MIYQHYKGNYYKYLHTAYHTETGERMAVYSRVGDPSKVWVRPFEMFFEDVEVDGKKIPRFLEVRGAIHLGLEDLQ